MPIGPYLAGSVVGMAFWSTVYASLGGASRSLLRQGVKADVLLAGLPGRKGIRVIEGLSLGVGVGGGGMWRWSGCPCATSLSLYARHLSHAVQPCHAAPHVPLLT
jgi:hypothetical protein